MKSLYKAHTGIFLPLAKSGSKVFVTRKFAVDSNQFLRLKKRIKSITWGCTVSKFLRSGLCKIFAKCYPNFPSYWLHLPRNFLKLWPEMKDVQCFLQVKVQTFPKIAHQNYHTSHFLGPLEMINISNVLIGIANQVLEIFYTCKYTYIDFLK